MFAVAVAALVLLEKSPACGSKLDRSAHSDSYVFHLPLFTFGGSRQQANFLAGKQLEDLAPNLLAHLLAAELADTLKKIQN